MNYTHHLLQKLAAAAFFFVFAATTAHAQAPSGTVGFETASGTAGAGETLWGGCTLLYKGKLYTCTISGLSVPQTGGAIVTRVSGTAYDLKDVGAFAGTYKSTGDDFSMGRGHLTLKNQNGVKMVVNAFSQMAELQVADSGVEIKLKTEK